MRLNIQRVKIVPPIPTMIIVIPNVQLSMMNYLLMTDGDHELIKNDLAFYR
jgi:hypothetical protein